MAAGLLGGGSRFLGINEDTGRFLAEAIAGELAEHLYLISSAVARSDNDTTAQHQTLHTAARIIHPRPLRLTGPEGTASSATPSPERAPHRTA
ncbi:hypothetical protein [Streptomyces hokutonensis]|uniref:hypothetical protein n=1 Tax=Streptomyces hokutonensis TaxID=1306990 RepID=UPI00381881A4